MNKIDYTDCATCAVADCIVAKYCNERWKSRINRKKTVSIYKKKQLIEKQDTEAFGMDIVHSGKVLIVSEQEHTNKRILRLTLPGEMIEHHSQEDRLSFPFSAEAFEDTIICFLPKETFHDLLLQYPKIAIHLEKHYANQFVRAEKRLNNAMRMNVRAKVAEALLMIDLSCDGEICFSRKELGELIGISPEQVSRQLRSLISEKIIEKQYDKKIIIRDYHTLLSIVGIYDGYYSEVFEGSKSLRNRRNKNDNSH